MTKFKKWLLTFTIVIALGLIGVAGLTIYVDPFFQYHSPLSWFPYLVDHQVNMNPGLAENMEYDSVLLGSSMTTNFDTSKFMDEMGLKTQKLSYNGAYPKDQDNIMKIVFEEKGDTVTDVFLCVDELNYSADVDTTKYPVPEHLYDDNLLNDVQYIWNKDVLLNYILRPMVDTKDKSDWNLLYKQNYLEEHYNKASVLMFYEPAEISTEEVDADIFIEAIDKNLDVNILPYIEAHPETTFHIFYPPYSILYWYNQTRQNSLDAVIEKYRFMTNRFLEYDNVEVYFFQNQEEVICNLNNYADYTHFHGRICDYMVQCFANGDRRVTKESLEEELSVLYDLTVDYDYEAIWDNWYE